MFLLSLISKKVVKVYLLMDETVFTKFNLAHGHLFEGDTAYVLIMIKMTIYSHF